jgi:nicotinamide-nucleotide amidase
MYKKIKQIISKLKNKKINLSIAESCTGGMFAQNITSVGGASKIFTFGIVTYSNQSKIKYLKVPSKILKKFGAVSEECCYSMVTNLAKISMAKLNIAITGVAGPDGGTKEKPVGLVYIGLKKNKKIKIKKYLFKSKDRENIRKNSVKMCLDLINEFI